MAQIDTLVPHAIRRHAAAYLADELDHAMGAYTVCVARRDVTLPAGLQAAALYGFPLGWGIAHVIVTEPVDAATLDAWVACCADEGIDLVLWIWESTGLQPIVTWAVARHGSAYLVSPRAAGVRLVRARLRGDPRDAWDRRGALEHAVATTLRTALVRCLELRGPIDVGRFGQALEGRYALKTAFGSILADARRRVPGTRHPALEESFDGTYTAAQLDAVLPEVPRLPPAGIRAARAAAEAYETPECAPDRPVSVVRPREPSPRPSPQSGSWLAPTAVWYQDQRFGTRLAARWAVFFDALAVRWSYRGDPPGHSAASYAPGMPGAGPGAPMLQPEFWLPDQGCLLVVRHVYPAWDELEQVPSLAMQAGVPVVVLHGPVGIEAAGRIWLPDAESATAYPGARWVACAHCGSLALTAALNPTTMLVRCGDEECRAKRGLMGTRADLRAAALVEATAAARTASFAPAPVERLADDETAGQVA